MKKYFLKICSSQSKRRRFFMIVFIFGIGLASFFNFDYFLLYISGLCFIFFIFLFWSNIFFRFFLIAILILIIAIFRYQLALPLNNESKIWFYNNQKIEFIGVVLAEPDYRLDHLKLTVSVREVIKDKNIFPVSGKVLIKTGLYPQYQYGDELRVTCKLLAPEPIEQFQYDRYLGKEDIYSVCYLPKINLLDFDKGNYFITRIYEQKNYWQKMIDRNLPEPHAGLFSAMILGARRGIPQSLNENFNITGTTHLIAISGFNISIIVTILIELAILFYIPRKKAFWLVTLVLIWYIIIIGFSASAVRAAIMGWLVILARYVGRLAKLNQAILLAAVIMLLINPKILRDDASFQLSFLALLGLAYLVPFFQTILRRMPENFGFKESLQTTLAAQAATMPLIAYSFGRVSLIAPIVNLLAIPAAVWLTIFGTATIFVGLFFPFLEKFIFWPNYILLFYLIKLVDFFASFPLASINL